MPNPDDHSSGGEVWRNVAGISFPRPRWLLPFVVLVLPFFLLFFPLGLISVVMTLISFLRGDLLSGLGFLWFASCGLILSCGMAWQARIYWKSRHSPLAVITSDGIYMPFNAPEYVLWSDVDTVDAFHIKGTAHLDLRVSDPTRIFGKRRGWWYLSWRDRVTLRIGSTSNPVLQAARDAHNRWVAQLGS